MLNDATEVILLSEGGSELVKDASSAANPVAYGVDEVALGHIMDKIPAMYAIIISCANFLFVL